MGLCGACFVLVDGSAVASCETPVWSVDGRTVTTVEGLGTHGGLHAVQQAILDNQAAQCAFCISGIAVSAVALLEREPAPDEAQVMEALERHLCRCGVQRRVVEAVVRAGQPSPDGPASP
jgi:nicotinate dehydrogenase subunit A